jgi:MFS family permease
MRSSVKRFGAGLSANVVLLAVVSFFVDLSSEIIFPLLPFFMVIQLGASYFIVGIMEGLAEFIASIIKVFSGHWSDRTKRRKPFISGGYGHSALLKLFFSLSTVWQHFFVLRIGERVGKGIREPARDALVAESCPPEDLGKSFGFQRALDTSGAILGPIFGIILLAVFVTSYQPIFLIASIPAFVAFGLSLLLREKKTKKKKTKTRVKLGFKFLPVRLKVFVVIATIFAMGNFSFFFVMLRAVDLGQSQTMTLAFYLLMNIWFAASAIPAGALSDKIGRVPTIAVGYVFFAAMSFLFAFEIPAILIAFSFILFGLSNGFIDGVQRAFVSDLAPEDIKATCLGTYHMSVGIGRLTASVLAGAIWTFYGVEYTFFYGMVLSVMAATMLTSILRK